MIELPPDCATRHEPLRALSTGGFGTALLCRQLSLDRTAVVKLLHQDLLLEQHATRPRLLDPPSRGLAEHRG